MKIVVLCGGTSPEREVSLNSGKAVAEALSQYGYKTELCDITSISGFISEWPSYKADGVFIALHGGWGEDGRLQAVLDAFGIKYTGSGPEASMLSMDKTAAKYAFSAAGVPVPEGFIAARENDGRDAAEKFLSRFGRIIVKPNSGGSTVGVTQISDIAGYGDALELAWQSEKKALVEEFIEGEEATVPVFELPDGRTAALPAIHIKPKTGFYDYRNKYTPGSTEYICPADFPESVSSRLAELAVAAHKAIGCRCYSRIDFRVSADGSLRALEANTAPGMTATSLVPKSAKAQGIPFGEFLDSVIKISFAIDRNEK
ncbi:MAG: D-alanine--D-alanine ligase [Synergistes sp.]|nr:D-alanine--D-alanine ligase [Synergistes sp.]